MKRFFVCASLLLLGVAGACGGSVISSQATFPNEGDAATNPVHLDGGVVLTPDAAIPGVSRNGWTWENGGPQAADLNGVWGSGPTDVWFVGAAGTILHWNGHAFSAPESGSGAALGGVWGSGPNDVWTAGSNDDATSDVLHWNGTEWSRSATIPAADLVGVGGSGPTDVWAIGFNGAWHFDGASWTPSVTPKGGALRAVWASDPHNAWAVGDPSTFTNPIAGAVLHWDGSSWSVVTTGTTNVMDTTFSVWGTSPSDVWIAGETTANSHDPYTPSGVLTHWDGSAWGAPFVLPAYSPMAAVTATTPGDARAVGWGGQLESWNGSAWEAEMLAGQYDAIWESGPSDIWAVGRGGVMAHFDGAAWTQITPPPPPLGLYQAAAIRANTKADAWVVGNDAVAASILHWDGRAWSASSIPAGSSAYAYFHALWGTGPSDVWGAGATSNDRISVPRIVHFDGASWSKMYDAQQNGEYASFRAAWGSGANDVWFAGDEGLVVHWDGSVLSPPVAAFGTTDSFYAVGGTSAHDVWLVSAVGSANRFHHYDGHTWTTVFTDVAGTLPVTGLYVATPTDAWAVGVEGGPAYHFDGSTWSRADATATHALESSLGIWGSDPNDIWAVGQNGSVRHYQGTTWNAVPLTSDTIVGVSGTGPDDVWMLTSAGAILHHP